MFHRKELPVTKTNNQETRKQSREKKNFATKGYLVAQLLGYLITWLTYKRGTWKLGLLGYLATWLLKILSYLEEKRKLVTWQLGCLSYLATWRESSVAT